MKPLVRLQFFILLAIASGPVKCFSQCYDIYGLSTYGGDYGAGAIVKTDEKGNSREVYSFFRVDTQAPKSQFCMADGNLYAVSSEGGKYGWGVLFQWDPETNEYLKKINFKNDSVGQPFGSLIQAKDGNFYGMTQSVTSSCNDWPFERDGSFYDCENNCGHQSAGGVIFKWNDITGSFEVKHRFETETGMDPMGSLVQTENGLMYGITLYGGENDCGVLFEWDPESGVYQNLISLDTIETGFNARSSLTVSEDGKLYGVTTCGGNYGLGVLFEYDPLTGNFLKRIDFNGSETGSHPQYSLTLADNGKLYGTTLEGGLYGHGVLLEWDPVNNEFNKLLDFNNSEKITHPVGPLTLDENGILVGVSISSVFEFDTKTNSFTNKFNFNSFEFLRPISSLTKAENGKFYGFSGNGGIYRTMYPPFFNYGVIYEWDPELDSCIIKLRFNDTDYGSWPESLDNTKNGKFYGSSSVDEFCRYGLIFEFDPDNHSFKKLKDLDGGVSPGPLLKASNGKYYGWTRADPECLFFSTLFEWEPLLNHYSRISTDQFQFFGRIIEVDNKIYFPVEIGLLEWDPNADTLIKSDIFEYTDSIDIFSLIQANDSIFYGAFNRRNLGILYEWNQEANTYKVLHRINDIDFYEWELGKDLTLAENGKLYGTLNTVDSGYYVFEWDPLDNSIKRLFDLEKSENFIKDIRYTDIVVIERYSRDTIDVAACNEIVSPSGKYTWTESGIYKDTLSCITGCDSILTVNLTVHNSSESQITATSCDRYISPSGKIWTQSGNYMDTIQGFYGCDSIIEVSLTINVVDTSVINDQVLLKANASNAQYQWIDCSNENAPIEGETGQSFTAATDGSYAVIINQNGCIDTSRCFAVSLTGLVLSTFKQNIILYPNPTDGSFTIDMGSELPECEISIIQPDGKMIHKEYFKNRKSIDLRFDGEPGFYMVIIRNVDEQAIFRISKR